MGRRFRFFSFVDRFAGETVLCVSHLEQVPIRSPPFANTHTHTFNPSQTRSPNKKAMSNTNEETTLSKATQHLAQVAAIAFETLKKRSRDAYARTLPRVTTDHAQAALLREFEAAEEVKCDLLKTTFVDNQSTWTTPTAQGEYFAAEGKATRLAFDFEHATRSAELNAIIECARVYNARFGHKVGDIVTRVPSSTGYNYRITKIREDGAIEFGDCFCGWFDPANYVRVPQTGL
jgi:hypothetical protein